VGEEKEKGRYRGKGYKFLPGNQMSTKWQPWQKIILKTRILTHKAFIFDHYFSDFNALFLYTCPGVSVGVSACVSVGVSDRCTT
jgi:hypothetical protein